MNTQEFRAEFSSPYPAKNGVSLILSVDDEPRILLTRQQILESRGYKVLSASDGEQALQLFALYPVDLVLLDYLMPGIDGGTVAQEMKRHKPNVPVVIVTASALPEETVMCADCFVRKGDGPAQLLEKIAELLSSSSIRGTPGKQPRATP